MLRMFCLLTALCALPVARAADFGPFAEPDFPVLTSTVDFRGWAARGLPGGGIAVRGLIIKLPHNLYVCFDQDLLRVAGIWQGEPGGEFLTATTIPAISYHVENRKSEPGQNDLPKPAGRPLLATGPVPGWVRKAPGEVTPGDLADPRPPGPDPAEPGRGPLPPGLFRWGGCHIDESGVSLHYRAGRAEVTETFHAALAGELPVVRRRIRLSEITGSAAGEGRDGLTITSPSEPWSVVSGGGGIHVTPPEAVAAGMALYAAGSGLDFTCTLPGRALPETAPEDFAPAVTAPALAWAEAAPVKVPLPEGTRQGAFAVEDIPLPVPNPWKRNVRPSGIAFLASGTALITTIDGDLWTVSGLGGPGREAEWRRLAAGLHEPQSVAVQEGRIHVFTRDGIVRLDRDTRLSGRAQIYTNFANDFAQTGETREYAMDMVAKPGGGFYIAKGGQMITRKSRHGGQVLEVSADGQTVTGFCSGLRQPYLGIHPETGLLTASDQQGHWIPSTPVRYLRKGAYYGFEEAAPHPVPAVIDPPACWIPHEVNQSAAGQVWATDPRMGPLAGHLLHLMYFRPGILAFLPGAAQKQAATVPLGLSFEFPLLKGAINPADGLLYVCGFRIWGTESKRMAGLARVRPSGTPSPLPVAVRAVPQGIHLRFAVPLDAALCRPEHLAASRWNYRRTSGYGSAHYRLDGQPGMEPLPCRGVQRSADGRGLLIHLPEMKPADQYRLDWHLASAAGTPLDSFACLTLFALEPFDAAAAGFDPAFQPSGPLPLPAGAASEPSSGAGKQLVTTLGCLACHSTDGTMEGMKGPTWKDLYGSEHPLVTGAKYTADAAHLRESILEPAKKIRQGFAGTDTGMPPYAGILSEVQLQSIVLYLRSLSGR